MKKIIYALLTILAAVLVFAAIMFLFIQNKGKGALQITASPNAKVYLDDKLIGVTPLCKCNAKDMILEGEHKVKLVSTAGNFDPFEQIITINANVLTVIDKAFLEKGLDSASIISLSQISDKDAQISAISIPVGAKVFLDEQFKGQSPLLIKNVKEADHDLKITKNGYKDKTLRIKAVVGFKLEAFVYLGMDPNDLATASSAQLFLTTEKLVKKIIILDTPTGFLRVRDQASLLGAEVAQVKPNETYELLDTQNGWDQIKLRDGKVGWISSQYAQETK
jgi:hypothetical protein